MPLYEYRCRKCGAQVEKIQKFSDPLLRTCEKCGGPLVRLVSAPAFQFKGSGWYVTDYARKSSAGSPPGNDKPAADKSAAKPDASSGTSAKKPSETPATKSKD